MPIPDETVFIQRGRPRASVLPAVQVDYLDQGGVPRQVDFSEAAIIGRGQDCRLQLNHELVSRRHLAIFPDAGRWWARDLESSNGTLIGGRPIDKVPLEGVVTLELGSGGPRIRVTASAGQQSEPVAADSARIAKHYFSEDRPGGAGEHTMFIRQAFRDVKRRQRRLYLGLLSIVMFLLAVVGGYALFQHEQLVKTARLANDIFYDMKDLELQIANLEESIDVNASVELKTQVAESKRRLAAMRERYDAFVEKVQEARPIPLDSEDKLILQIARTFGETEVDVPTEFAAEVKSYIRKWRSSPRLIRAIRRLNENGYAPIIQRALTEQGLPAQFIYLALQETNYQPQAVGPPTRYGRAKGMWQFIPATAKRYGLRVGPLQDLAQFDPEDERHDVAKATQAAARYLKDIYRTDAQASGLLVMASYNWGEGNIIKRLRQMPKDPRERNFWKLLRQHQIPNETYDYVFYIVSAAVICENPALFGFDFQNPLRAD
jgi:membrane-bound lytic murein transglycosylase D